ncbi:hypothetical protein SARC_04430 [Sphaeroforma arctica JP610]|uniref:Major facilitator superfamily (MFS) profile domain-containing protein n=1 Tax=Sphaeroforma arctica JP610 TaxID=667725 RepID=A0A0L0G2K2_9EUKA|nr:hypothetical protein SARC_04430 [Sphaeroforma arctica JP610]KNC83305.1 hypothetical protein SARC_04430 [Sphaeroforma arctica JP610]|eukprot:XP_014157207.1 hypothetical protein SARC_04430 [Sphaeroforma arctica JP610]
MSSTAYNRLPGDEETALAFEHSDLQATEDPHKLTSGVPRNRMPDRSLLHLFGLNSFAFAYGLLISTFGLVTLPTESQRMYPKKHAIMLAVFLGVCGISQLSGPVAGFFSDRCTHSLGRRRPFMLYGGLVGIPSLFMLRWASMELNLYMYVFFFMTAMLALNVMYVAYSGALTDLVNDSQRGVANGLMGAFTVMGASFGFGCFSYFLDVQSGYIFYIVVVSVAVVASLVSYVETPLTATTEWAWAEIGECYFVSPTDHRDFYLVFVSRTLYYMGISVQTFMLFYFRDIIASKDPQADVSYLALCGQLTGAIVCVPMGMLSDRVGRKSLIYLSSFIIVLAYIGFMFTRDLMSILIVAAVYGIGNGTYLSVDYALACDTLPSKESAARYLGVWGVGAFIGTLLGPMLIGPALLFFGDNGRVDEHGVPMYDIGGYIAILIIGSTCMIAGAAVIVPIRSAR